MTFGLLVAAVCLACASLGEAAGYRAPIHTVSKTGGDSPVRTLKLLDFHVFKQINDTGDGESGTAPRRFKRRPVRVGSILPDGKEQEFAKLVDNENQVVANDSSTELWDWKELSYTTSFGLGSPLQDFDAILSVSSSDLIVPSLFCDKLCPPGSRYDPAVSRTSIQPEEYMDDEYPRFLADSQLTEDTLRLAGIDVENQQFGAAQITPKPRPDSGHDGWAGVLGLAPGTREAEKGTASPFMNMIAQEKLDWNRFSLKLPRGENDTGEILFGEVNEDLYYGSMKKLPLIPYHPFDSNLNGRWAVPASGIGIGSGYASLYGYAAVIESDFPGIALPHLYTTILNMYLGMESLPVNASIPHGIDCDQRDSLESLTISLAEQRFVLTPWDYTIEVDLGWIGGEPGMKRCVSVFTTTGSSWERDFIVLGTPFLRKFYSVFDADGKTISCKWNIPKPPATWESCANPRSVGKLRDEKTEEGKGAAGGKVGSEGGSSGKKELGQNPIQG